ncbi:hypothetical protein [Caballeronia calidae]|uniref:hypothetical protein n=1 Tax=Caballeronia calidae TaxID=1777139 RepID=UPI0012FE6CE3|nr:hypothetical protein [Caballeronia calidae]
MTTHDETISAIAGNEQRIAVHEAVCAERYKGILDSFKQGDGRMQRIEKRSQRIEYIIYFLILAVLIGPSNALHFAEMVFR